jgi:toluene monooxygenase system ferredoxin subunit
MAFQKVATVDDLWSGEMLGLVVAGRKVLLVNLNGTIHAYEDKCAHLGVALSNGHLHGTHVTCRAHQWEYDLCTGRGCNPATVRLRTFAVQVEHGNILVDIASTASESPSMAERESDSSDHVGPVLCTGLVADAVIAAIRQHHVETVVLDRGAYRRVLVPGRCVVTRAAIAAHLGRPVRFPGDLEKVMPAFKGHFTVSEESAVWACQASASHHPEKR